MPKTLLRLALGLSLIGCGSSSTQAEPTTSTRAEPTTPDDPVAERTAGVAEDEGPVLEIVRIVFQTVQESEPLVLEADGTFEVPGEPNSRCTIREDGIVLWHLGDVGIAQIDRQGHATLPGTPNIAPAVIAEDGTVSMEGPPHLRMDDTGVFVVDPGGGEPPLRVRVVEPAQGHRRLAAYLLYAAMFGVPETN